MGVRDRDPEGGPESRLWAAVVERGQEPEQLDQTNKPSPASDRHREVTSGDETSSPPNPFASCLMRLWFEIHSLYRRLGRIPETWEASRKALEMTSEPAKRFLRPHSKKLRK
jgi:hypothetical protein